MKLTIKNQEVDTILKSGQVWKTENGYRLIVECEGLLNIVDLHYFDIAFKDIAINTNINQFYTWAKLVETELIIKE